MKLIEFMKNFKSVSEDTSDDVFDAVVTIEWEPNFGEDSYILDNYYAFCNKLYECVDFDIVNENKVWIVKWSKLIYDNIDLWKEWSRNNWREEYMDIINSDDVDEFVCTWVDQLHLLLAGSGTETEYHNLVVLLEKCK